MSASEIETLRVERDLALLWVLQLLETLERLAPNNEEAKDIRAVSDLALRGLVARLKHRNYLKYAKN